MRDSLREGPREVIFGDVISYPPFSIKPKDPLRLMIEILHYP